MASNIFCQHVQHQEENNGKIQKSLIYEKSLDTPFPNYYSLFAVI